MCLIWGDVWTESFGYPKTELHKDELKSLAESMHKVGLQLMPYLGFQVGDGCPEYKLYKDNIVTEPWVEGNGFRGKTGDIAYNCEYKGQWANFMIYNLDKTIRESGIDGFYMDGTAFPCLDKNIYNGSGYRDRNGKLKSTYGIFTRREFIKRIRTMAEDIKPGFWIDIHESDVIWTPVMAFGDSVWNGEQYAGLAAANGYSLKDVLSLDAFRAMFDGAKYGFHIDMLAYYDKPSAEAIALIHNVNVRGQRQQICDTQDAFGVNTAKWFPYYENSEYVTVSDPNVKVSFYQRKDGKILLAASNYGKTNSIVQVSLKFAKLHIPTNLSALDVLTRTELNVKDGTFEIQLAPWDFHYISIDGPQSDLTAEGDR